MRRNQKTKFVSVIPGGGGCDCNSCGVWLHDACIRLRSITPPVVLRSITPIVTPIGFMIVIPMVFVSDLLDLGV